MSDEGKQARTTECIARSFSGWSRQARHHKRDKRKGRSGRAVRARTAGKSRPMSAMRPRAVLPSSSLRSMVSRRSGPTGQYLARAKAGDFRFLSPRVALHARPWPEMARKARPHYCGVVDFASAADLSIDQIPKISSRSQVEDHRMKSAGAVGRVGNQPLRLESCRQPGARFFVGLIFIFVRVCADCGLNFKSMHSWLLDFAPAEA
jgi:hypothetical protein